MQNVENTKEPWTKFQPLSTSEGRNILVTNLVTGVSAKAFLDGYPKVISAIEFLSDYFSGPARKSNVQMTVTWSAESIRFRVGNLIEVTL